MIAWLRHLLGWLIGAFRSRQDLVLENLALRQQLLTLHAQRPRRRFTTPQKLFWVLLRKGWAGWRRPLILVAPRTVVGWHPAGFRLYWKWLSRIRSTGGRKPVSQEIRALILCWRGSEESLSTQTVGRLAVQRILEGYGYELTRIDVLDAFNHYMAAAQTIGMLRRPRADVVAMARKQPAPASDILIRQCLVVPQEREAPARAITTEQGTWTRRSPTRH